MDMRDIAKMQLEQFYRTIREDQGHRITIRNWCRTIWLALLAVIGSGKLQVSANQALLLSIMPICMFWLMESFHHVFITTTEERAKMLEQMIVDDNYASLNPLQHFFVSGYGFVTYSQKIRVLLKAMFTLESVIIFYLLLAPGSIAFVTLLR
jgi:hypothetical protein